MLAADFVAVVQVLIYVGGILVLTLFAVMLTHRIADVRISNRSVGRVARRCIVVAAIGAVMAKAVLARALARRAAPGDAAPDDVRHRQRVPRRLLLPFELASVVLLAALIGAVVLSRKELQE